MNESSMNGQFGIDAPADAEPAIRCDGVGIKNRRGWAIRDCSFELPRGRVAALVGVNGAGKSTLLATLAGLCRPSTGRLSVLGATPEAADVLARTGSLLQDRPLPVGFTVAETLRVGRELNPRWDHATALQVLREAEVPLPARVSELSSGQRTCVALALVLGKRPELVLLDEPMADLDALRRHVVMATLMSHAAREGTTVVMSSHAVADLDATCDFLLLLSGGRMLVADDIAMVQAAHTLVTCTHDGRREGLPPDLQDQTVIEAKAVGRQLTALVQFATPLGDGWLTEEPSLEEILQAYLRSPDAPSLTVPGGDRHAPA